MDDCCKKNGCGEGGLDRRSLGEGGCENCACKKQEEKEEGQCCGGGCCE